MEFPPFRAALSHRTFCDDGNILFGTISHMCLLSTWNVAIMMKETNFKFYVIWNDLDLNLKSYMWLVATILDSALLEAHNLLGQIADYNYGYFMTWQL